MHLSFLHNIHSIMLSSVMLLSLLNLGCERVIQYERTHHPLPEGIDISDCETGNYGGIFILNETTQPTTFNPLVPNNLSTSMVLSRLLSSLVEFNPKTELFKEVSAETGGESMERNLWRDPATFDNDNEKE